MYCATIGFFDGVHLGHQFMLRQLWSIAKEEGLDPAILTFSEHPAKVLRGRDVPLLTTYSERMEMLKQFGVSQIFAFNFEMVHDMTAEQFMNVLKTQCGVELLLMGYDQHFGSDRMSRFADYEAAAMRVGLRLRLMPKAPSFGMEVNGVFSPFKKQDGSDMPDPSSSAIREALQEGDVSTANILLGRPYSLTGLVVEGKQIGRQMGFPTANIELRPGKLVPMGGVYLCQVALPKMVAKMLKLPAGTPLADGEKAYALLNIGTNPTVNEAPSCPLMVPENAAQEQPILMEIHVPRFEGNLYNKRLTVDIIRYLRPERKFDSLDELKQQIARDLESVPEE